MSNIVVIIMRAYSLEIAEKILREQFPFVDDQAVVGESATFVKEEFCRVICAINIDLRSRDDLTSAQKNFLRECGFVLEYTVFT